MSRRYRQSAFLQLNASGCGSQSEVLSFDPGEPERYGKDVPNAQVHVLDAGHFALDTEADEIAAVRGFMAQK